MVHLLQLLLIWMFKPFKWSLNWPLMKRCMLLFMHITIFGIFSRLLMNSPLLSFQLWYFCIQPFKPWKSGIYWFSISIKVSKNDLKHILASTLNGCTQNRREHFSFPQNNPCTIKCNRQFNSAYLWSYLDVNYFRHWY